jgi:hypothetical protein
MTAEALMASSATSEPRGTPPSDNYKNEIHHNGHVDDGSECFTNLAMTEKHNHLEYLKNFR